MKKRLDKLHSILDNTGLEYDAIALADALWLSQYIDSSDRVDIQDSVIEKQERKLPPVKPPISPIKEEKKTEATAKKVTIQIEGEAEISAHVSTKSTKNRGLSTGIKQEPYVFNQGALYSALRYFRQKRVSPSHYRLDIDKTVDIKADSGLFIPQYKPEYENRFNLLIVIDSSYTMELWREEIKKLTDGIKSFNLFRDIQEIYMDSSKEEPKFFKTRHLSGRCFSNISQYLIDETLVMIVSDMSSPSWRSGKIVKKLYSWQSRARLFAIQMFPSHLWDRTILKDTELVRFFGNRNHKFNSTLKCDADDMLDFLYDDFKNKNSLKLPIATMELNSLEALSKVIIGKDNSSVSGAIFYENKELEEKRIDKNDSKKVSIFYENSSKLAQELVHYLSVVPLEMNVMKMVQKLMLKESNKMHLAEVLTSGLLEKKDDLYSFYHVDKSKDGVREIFQNQLGTIKYIQTLKILSEYVGENLGFSSYFKAILQNSHTDKNGKLNRLDTEFARINIKRLQRLGGEYEKIAQRLMVEIEAIIPTTKRFQMGSNDHKDEKPVHEVIINYDFEISQYPVTFEEYDLFCEETKKEKPDDRGWGRANRPVINVSWHDAKEYCKWLSEKTKEEYRLPTEAEWEYSCRAGTIEKWSFGDKEKELEEYAWYHENSDSKTHPVGEKKQNPWGLYDMHGNVWEWCEDDFVDNYKETPRDGSANQNQKMERKVLRGGSWFDFAVDTRSAIRVGSNPGIRDNSIGFRLLRTLHESDQKFDITQIKDNGSSKAEEGDASILIKNNTDVSEFINNIDNSWQEIIKKAFTTFEPDYIKFLIDANDYFPDKQNFLNAFKTLSLENTKYILFGQDPYPRQESAIGYSFIDGKVESLFSGSGFSKEVNRATSLRNFMKMAFVCENELQEDFSKEAVALIDKTPYIKSIYQLKDNFEKNGVLLLNMALVFTTKEDSKKHVKAWNNFIKSILQSIQNKNIELILLGKIAQDIENIKESKSFIKHVLPHPYNIEFINDTKVHNLFKPMHLLKKEIVKIDELEITDDITFECKQCKTKYSLNCDDLDWEAVESNERGMGTETWYSAQYYDKCDNCDNEISLTFNCWEYPIGVENYRDIESSGVENIEGNCCLDFMENKDFNNEPDYEEISIDDIKEWFFENYENPANSLPYISKEGGYQWIHGEPYDAEEAIYEKFEGKCDENILKQAIEDINSEYGYMQWSPIPVDEDDFQDRLGNWAKKKADEDES